MPRRRAFPSALTAMSWRSRRITWREDCERHMQMRTTLADFVGPEPVEQPGHECCRSPPREPSHHEVHRCRGGSQGQRQTGSERDGRTEEESDRRQQKSEQEDGRLVEKVDPERDVDQRRVKWVQAVTDRVGNPIEEPHGLEIVVLPQGDVLCASPPHIPVDDHRKRTEGRDCNDIPHPVWALCIWPVTSRPNSIELHVVVEWAGRESPAQRNSRVPENGAPTSARCATVQLPRCTRSAAFGRGRSSDADRWSRPSG